VTELFPDFKLGDVATTKQVQVQHLICACTGMPRQDLEWLLEYRSETPASAMKLLGLMQPTTRFGEVFQSSNLMAAAAGFVGGAKAVPGKEWGVADGKPEAEQMLKVAAAQRKAAIAKACERLVVPADPTAVAKLAPRYVSSALGEMKVLKEVNVTVFDVGEWKSAVASRKNDDETTSFLTIDPTLDGFEFVVADKGGKRELILRDAQHEYVFVAHEATAKR
jgi:hypothetical protein